MCPVPAGRACDHETDAKRGLMDLISDLEARGLIHDATDLGALRARLAEGPIGIYCGFDPTADSLHAGHLLGQVTLRRFQLAGHRPYPLAGGATGMVGDPSGRSEERNLLDRDTLRANVAAIKGQLERILDFSPSLSNRAVLVDNADWTAPVAVLDSFRDVGKHVTVNQMVAKESVRSRMDGEAGLSYTEFSYMLLQANDFRWLCQHEGCEMQVGGSDQWGNITLGIDLIRRTLARPAYGLTWPLLTKSDGTKFGKTSDGAVWLDPRMTSPYQFRQFWVQADDAEVERYLLQFTLRTVDDVRSIMAQHLEAPERRLAQRTLARDLTSLVHGQEAAEAADAAADLLFGGDPTTASREAFEAVRAEVPASPGRPDELDDLVALLVRTGLASSNSDARRTLAQRGITANGRRLDGDAALVPAGLLHGRYLLLRKGRTTYHLVDFLRD
jgi:tyrosyl-tRNA synthetase